MKRLGWLTISLILGCMSPVNQLSAQTGQVHIIDMNGVIGPAEVDYFSRSLKNAVETGDVFLLLRLNSPGGLDSSIRDMIAQILSSPIPVVVYVAPAGASVVGNSIYLLHASHIAAMASETWIAPMMMPLLNMEKAPIQSTSPPRSAREREVANREATNKAITDLEKLTALHGRDGVWIEEMLREPATLTAETALKNKVIDILAERQSDLIRELEGRKVRLKGREATLNTQSVILHEIQPDWLYQALKTISKPNIAYMLLMLSIYGLVLILAKPSVAIVPGAISIICSLLALYAFLKLPVNETGLCLILTGIALMVFEAVRPLFGIAGLAGVALFVYGSLVFIKTGLPDYDMKMDVVAGMTVFTVLVILINLPMIRRHHSMVTDK